MTIYIILNTESMKYFYYEYNTNPHKNFSLGGGYYSESNAQPIFVYISRGEISEKHFFTAKNNGSNIINEKKTISVIVYHTR